MTRRRMPARDERGVTLILVALLLVALLVMAAIVLDTGLARADRRANKAITDAAAIAAAEAKKAGPWPAVCEAYAYVLANGRRFSSWDAEKWTHAGAPGVATYSNPCSTLTVSPFNLSCDATNPATWARFEGTAAGGDVEVVIQTGYTLPDPDPEYATEDAAVTGDNGLDACDNIAVKLADRRAANFSTVIGAGPIVTNTRSVARLTNNPLEVAALVVLEATDCGALTVKANNPSDDAGLIVSASGNRAGIMQIDSDGSTSCGGSARVVEGSPLPSTGMPSIVAKPSTGPPVKQGQIGILAMSTNPAKAYTDPDCADPSDPTQLPCAITPKPVAKARLGRGLLDDRYLGDSTRGLKKLRNDARDLLDNDDPTPTPANPYPGYTRFTTISGSPGCSVNGAFTVTAARVYIDCDTLKLTGGGNLVFTGTVTEIVTKGDIEVGPGTTLVFEDPRRIYVEGKAGPNAIGLDSSGTMLINPGAPSGTPPAYGTCAARQATAKDDVTKLVVNNGGFSGSANASSKLQMCQTTLLMAAGAAFPAVDGNSYNGRVLVGAQGTVEWSAPNRIDTVPAVQANWDDQEDLALWTETTPESKMTGGSSLGLSGVFALPNAEPFVVSGSGSGDISANAQFWTHKLSITGKGIVTMVPNPNDSVPVFGKSLVR